MRASQSTKVGSRNPVDVRIGIPGESEGRRMKKSGFVKVETIDLGLEGR